MNTYVIIALVILAIVGFWAWKRKNKSYTVHYGLEIPKKFPFQFTTPLGVTVLSLVDVPTSALTVIDDGISTQIGCINQTYPSWGAFSRPETYTVIFINPTEYHPTYNWPSLTVGGRRAAGTCLGIGGDNYKTPSILLPHQGEVAWGMRDYLKNSVWYESEHVREWVNDPVVFFNFIGANDLHPHIPCPGVNRSSASKFVCGESVQ